VIQRGIGAEERQAKAVLSFDCAMTCTRIATKPAEERRRMTAEPWLVRAQGSTWREKEAHAECRL
jgi:hypothetical protein